MVASSPWRRWFGGTLPSPPRRAIDLPVDGPEADALVARFSDHLSKLPARLLVVRATREPWPTWLTIDADHGWGIRADHVEVLDLPANHLGVLLEPHVHELGQAVAKVIDGAVREPPVP